jgi:hypothetical protein
VVVGADTGDAAYVFERSGGNWIQQAKLTASDPSDHPFVDPVAISDNTIVVGLWNDDVNGPYSGSVFVYQKPETGWGDMTETAKLTASDGAPYDSLGIFAVVSGDTIVVTAEGDDDSEESSGSAYIYEKPVTGWVDMTETAKITASDGAASNYFGKSAAINGNTIVVGTYNSAYLFEKPVTGWVDMTETAKLTPGDSAPRFGWSVSVNGDTAIVGTKESTAAYIFKKPVTGWVDMTETAKLTPSDGADKFGFSVGISGNKAIVGAYGENIDTGSAFIFQEPVTGWVDMTETTKLTASDGAPGDLFGQSVGISGDTAVVGAWGDDDNGTSSGVVFIYQLVVVLVENLIVDIETMDLPQNTEKSLKAPLKNTIELVEDSNPNNDGAAINKTEAFINKVEAQRGKKIATEDADALIVKAQEIITAIAK